MKRYTDVDGYVWEERPGDRLVAILTPKGEAISDDYPDYLSEVARNYGPLTEITATPA